MKEEEKERLMVKGLTVAIFMIIGFIAGLLTQLN